MGILKKSAPPPSCSVTCFTAKWLLALLFFIVAIGAAIGVYQTHVVASAGGAEFAFQFGSTSGSLAIIAFCAAAMCWSKQMCRCMKKCEVCSK